MHAYETNPPWYGFVNPYQQIMGTDERTPALTGWAKSVIMNLSLRSGLLLQPLRVTDEWCHAHCQSRCVGGFNKALNAATGTGDTYAVFFQTKETNK